MRGGEHHGRPGLQVHQTKTALRIGQELSGGYREPAAHPTVYASAQPGHSAGIAHPIPDHQMRGRVGHTGKEQRNVLGRMLAVPIESKRPIKIVVASPTPTGLQGSSFAAIPLVAHYNRSSIFGCSCGLIT